MRSALIVLTILLCPAFAEAGLFHISVTGMFDSGADTTSISAPNESFSLSFDVVDPVADFTPATFSNAVYLLGGQPVAPTIDSIEFYADFNGGLFNPYFSDNTTISFFGDQLFDASGNLQPGTYSTAGLFPSGTATIRVSTVPEPASVTLAGLGLVGMGAVAMRRRRAQQAA